MAEISPCLFIRVRVPGATGLTSFISAMSSVTVCCNGACLACPQRQLHRGPFKGTLRLLNKPLNVSALVLNWHVQVAWGQAGGQPRTVKLGQSSGGCGRAVRQHDLSLLEMYGNICRVHPQPWTVEKETAINGVWDRTCKRYETIIFCLHSSI